MSRSIENDKGASEAPFMLRQICQALFPDAEDYHIRLADLLGVKTKMIKGWFAGKTKTMNRSHDVFATLEQILLKREQELNQMRLTLHRWRSE